MHRYCVIIIDDNRRRACAAAVVEALRKARHESREPRDAAAFVNCGSASRFTFLLPTAAAVSACELLGRHDAARCASVPNLCRYAALRL